MYLGSTYKLLHADTEKIPQPMVAAFPALSLYTWPDLASRAEHRQVGKQRARAVAGRAACSGLARLGWKMGCRRSGPAAEGI